MKKTLLITSMIMGGVFGATAQAASNVTLYGVIETGVLVEHAKHKDTTVSMKSGFDQGSRWGLKGTEDLGNGYSVGFILEQGFNADDGTEGVNGKQFNRESVLNVKGNFGALTFGRTGALASGAQSQSILTGWALGTGYGMSAWNAQTVGTLRMNNTVSYVTPAFSGFTLHAMYSNGIGTDYNKTKGTENTDGDTNKWSKNSHYYGLGVKYQEGALRGSLIFEALDNKGAAVGTNDEAQYRVNFGAEYNLGAFTPMFAYQWVSQDDGMKTHKFGLSAKVPVAGGDVLVGAAYLFGKNEAPDVKGDDDVRNWNIGAAYVYPLSKRTAVKAYAGYSDSSKLWKDKAEAAYNGYNVFVGLRHAF